MARKERSVRSKRKVCPIRINGERCQEKTLRGSIFCKKHDGLVTTALIECTGEAHSNPYIDHCMMCAPRWGQREILVPKPGACAHKFKEFRFGVKQCTECGAPREYSNET